MPDEATLARFVEAQATAYDTALSEIRAGAKQSHWMWFIFLQLRSLGHSPTAQYYGIKALSEAQAYLSHPLLGIRYRECVKALQGLKGSDAVAVFGTVDAMKLRSSLTLFEAARPCFLFEEALERWFDCKRDMATHRLLA